MHSKQKLLQPSLKNTHTQIKKKDEIELKKNPVCVVKSSYLQNCVH